MDFQMPDQVTFTDLDVFLDWFSQGIQNLVTKILDYACGTRSRSGDLHRFGWFNLCLDRFSQGILNLHTEFWYLVCSLQYCCFLFLTLKMGLLKCNIWVQFYISSGLKFSGDFESAIIISIFHLYHLLLPNHCSTAIVQVELSAGNVPSDIYVSTHG